MAVNVEVRRSSNENTPSLIRRFTKRVQGSGILPRMRSIRYRTRPKSKFAAKKQRLKSIGRKERFEELVKLGKLPERPARRFGRFGRRK